MVNGKVIDGRIVKSAFAQLDQAQGEVVIMNLTGAGSPLFDAIAGAHYHSLIANELDGQVLSAPVMLAQNFNGTAQISGGFTQSAANNLALDLNYGSLPVKLNVQSSQTVSPSLGKTSLRAGLLAGLLGLLLV